MYTHTHRVGGGEQGSGTHGGRGVGINSKYTTVKTIFFFYPLLAITHVQFKYNLHFFKNEHSNFNGNTGKKHRKIKHSLLNKTVNNL